MTEVQEQVWYQGQEKAQQACLSRSALSLSTFQLVDFYQPTYFYWVYWTVNVPTTFVWVFYNASNLPMKAYLHQELSSLGKLVRFEAPSS